jgi:hypothetical protein
MNASFIKRIGLFALAMIFFFALLSGSDSDTNRGG